MAHTSGIQQTKKREFSLVTRILRKQSVVVAYYLSRVGITALQVLFFRVIFFGGGSLFFFYSQSYIDNLIGLFLIALCYFFDQVDGDLARNYDKVTKVGWFLDGNFDAVVLNSIILTFTLKFLNDPNIDMVYVIAGIAILFGTIFSAKMSELYQNHFSIGCGVGSSKIESYLEHHSFDALSHYYYRLITPKGFPFSFLSNFRDYLLIGVIFNVMPYALLAFAIAINIRWISLFVLTACYYNGITHEQRSVAMFNLLKKSETGYEE